MLRWTTRIAAVLALTIFPNMVFAQVEFSADMVDLSKADAPANGRIYFGKDNLRVESLRTPGQGAYLMNLATQSSTILMPQQHMYITIPAGSQGQRMTHAVAFFRTGDAENACADWQSVDTNKGGSCKKVGTESINGRSAVKYEASNNKGEVGHFWVDPKLRFAVKWQEKNSDGELRNIQEGAQPAALFEIPAGYTEMKMPAMTPKTH